uniref:RFX-type winged-helix domain-containing protein n=1 Tax=Heterorhabditis bacteriophora TaxID=37862 RepID=A0A1I7WNH6_HETBA
MWKHFDVFRRSVDINLRKYGLNSGEAYETYMSKAFKVLCEKCKFIPKPGLAESAISRSVQRPGSGLGTRAIPLKVGSVPNTYTPTAAKNMEQILSSTVNKQRLNNEVVCRAWAVDSLISKEEWTQWLLKLRVAFIKALLKVK